MVSDSYMRWNVLCVNIFISVYAFYTAGPTLTDDGYYVTSTARALYCRIRSQSAHGSNLVVL